VTPNADGLVDSFDDAIACCRSLDASAGTTEHAITRWRPWLVVRYALAQASDIGSPG
jgi:hypothetical protein